MQDMLTRFFEDKYEVYQANAGGQLEDEIALLTSSITTSSDEFINAYEFTADKTAFYNFIFTLSGSTSYLTIRILVNGNSQYVGAYNGNTGWRLTAGTHINQGDKVAIQIQSRNGYSAGLEYIRLYRIFNADITTWTNNYTPTITFYPKASGQMLLVAFPNGTGDIGTISMNNVDMTFTRLNYSYAYYTFIQVYKGKPVTITGSTTTGSFVCAYYSKIYKNIKNVKSIQRGFINNTGITSVKIGEINPNKTICLLDGEFPGLINVNRLEEDHLIINNRSNSAPVSYQLVEFW